MRLAYAFHMCLVFLPTLASFSSDYRYGGEERYANTNGKTDLTFVQLQRLIQTLPQNNLASLIASLPESFRENYVLMHHSRSAQRATPLKPRVIMFGNTAKLMMSYSDFKKGESGECETLETIEFSDKENRFTMREVKFCNGQVEYSQDNPASCLFCHQSRDRQISGNDPRPNWEPYNLWPQTYQPDSDSLFNLFEKTGGTEEDLFDNPILKSYDRMVLKFSRDIKERYQEFVDANRNNPLYSQLQPIDPTGNFQSAELTNRISQLNMRRIARITQDSQFDSIRPLLLGPAVIKDCIEDQELEISQDQWNQLAYYAWDKLKYKPLYLDIVDQSIKSASPEQTYPLFRFLPEARTYWTLFSTAIGADTEDWSTSFTLKGRFANQQNRFSDPSNAHKLIKRAFEIVYSQEDIESMSCEKIQAALDDFFASPKFTFVNNQLKNKR